MLDIGWTELLVIAVILIVVVGPKDLPPMLRAFGKMMTRLRKTAGEFRSQFDEALRESELDDVRKTIADVQKLNPASSLRDAMNPLRQMGNEIKADLKRATAVEMPPATGAEAEDEPVEMPPPFPAPAPAASLAAVPPELVSTPQATAPATPSAATAPAAKMADPAPAKPAPAKAVRTRKAPESAAVAPEAAKAKRSPAKRADKAVAPEAVPAPVTKAPPRKKPTTAKPTTAKKDNA